MIQHREPNNKIGVLEDLSATPEELHRWTLQGINYLLSDRSTKSWREVFSIYTPEAVLPNLEEAQGAILGFTPGGNTWTTEMRVASAWLTSKADHILMYYREAVRRLMASGCDDWRERIFKPQDRVLWAMFEDLREKILQTRLSKSDKSRRGPRG